MNAGSIPLTIREKVETEIIRMVAICVIEQVDFSEWTSPIIPNGRLLS